MEFNLIIAVCVVLGLSYVLYHVIVYYFTRVPYVATPKKRFNTIFKELSITPETVMYDLGCGNGSFLFAAERYGFKKLVGVELSPLLAWCGVVKSKLVKSKVIIRRENFFHTNIHEADIIYLFLVQNVVDKIISKLKNEAKKGAIIICLADTVKGFALEKVIDTNPGNKHSTKIYFYKNFLNKKHPGGS
ncbi:MAG: class I SAM-dependent methyltransferase [Candidatus Magasanikbacteria bacterium]